MKKHKTPRGFTYYEFKDSYSQKCSIQNSSNIIPHIWLGVKNSGPDIDGPQGTRNEECHQGMHLNKKNVRYLIKKLQKFLDEDEV